ncbi:hypothetical protein HDU67_001398 [Dinochytrium kinnereticum]|nr:hypothetical protein HDU67_001398 [Dinochytrium kinnereticum]
MPSSPSSSPPPPSYYAHQSYDDDAEGNASVESTLRSEDRQPLLMMRSSVYPSSSAAPSRQLHSSISTPTNTSGKQKGHHVSQDIAGWSSSDDALAISLSRGGSPSSRRSTGGRTSSGRRPSRVHWDDDDDSKESRRGGTIKIVLMPVATSGGEKRTSRGRTLGIALLVSALFFIYLPFSFLASLVHPTSQIDWPPAEPALKVPRPPAEPSPQTVEKPSPAVITLTPPSPSTPQQCAQSPLILPSKDPQLDATYDSLYEHFSRPLNATYAHAVAERLAGLVRINTEAFDDQNGILVPQDPAVPDPDFARREGFIKIREYIVATWPKVNSNLKMEIVNRYGILYRWQGSDSKRRPVLLTAHLDVVPAPKETLSQWTYPPFVGTIADGYVWGRGAHDCKAQMIEILEAVENLITSGFKPSRTVLIAFGFDEEIGGMQGAKHLAARIRDMGYHNGEGGIPIAFLVDEGSSISTAASIGLLDREPDDKSPLASFAAVSTSEKGYMDLEITLRVPGGHSSAPPKHTGIGLSGLVVRELEDHPFPMAVPERSPLLEQFGCWSRFGAVSDEGLRRCVGDVVAGRGGEERRRELVERVGGLGDGFRALLGTTQAVDVIHGGVKVNSLPEQVTITVNYRIASGSTVISTEDHLLKVLQPLASLQNLTLIQTRASRPPLKVNSPADPNNRGSITLKTLPDSFDPSPVAPSDSRAFQHVSSAIRRTLPLSKDEMVVVHPAEGMGNTDTIHYGGVVGGGNLFRFSPLRDAKGNRIHTVDERVRVDDLVRASAFFFELLRGVDGDLEV